jgi:tetratricopeptide (TPR) repeat protein
LTEASGQAQPKHLADSLFASKRYFEASIEYQRAIFNQPAPGLLAEARYQKALCYRHLGRYEDALKELNQIGLFSLEDSLKTGVLYEKAFNLMLSEDHSEALMNIQRIREKQLPQTTRHNLQPLKIIILNNNRQWQKAEQTFRNWIASRTLNNDEKARWKDTLSLLYSEDNLPKNYSQERARNWSRFIPGAGHAYAGHPWEGAASFLLNGAAIGLGIHQIWKGYYFTAYVAGFGVFYKTYFGGMERAANLASLEKENEMEAFNKKCARLIQKIIQHQSTHHTKSH